jgi:ParB family chromosome partitioning protein
MPASQPHTIQRLPVAAIIPGDNDRTVFKAIDELAESIVEHGLAQPITVRPVTHAPGRGANDGHYEIVDDEGAAAIMLLENVQRADLNPVDEGRAYAKRMKEFGWSERDIANRANVSKGRVESRLALLHCVPEVQKLIADGNLAIGYGVAMSPLDPNRQRIAMRYVRDAKRPTVAEFHEVCSRLLEEQRQEAMFDMDLFIVQSNEAAEAEEARWTARRFPVDETLPEPDKVLGGISTMFEHYLAKLIEAGEINAAGAVGRLCETLLNWNSMRPPKESPLDEVYAAWLASTVRRSHSKAARGYLWYT